jgi:hypothetical protein
MSRVKPQVRVPKTRRDALRRHLEGFDRIDIVSDEVRDLVAESFPELLAKLPRSVLRRRGGQWGR